MFTGCSHDVCISNGNIVYYDQKEFDDPQVSDDPKVVSNKSMDLNDPKEPIFSWFSMSQFMQLYRKQVFEAMLTILLILSDSILHSRFAFRA